MSKKGWQTITFLVLVAGIPLLFAERPYFLSTLVLIGINAIAAISLSLLLGQAGLVSLGHAAFYGIGAYATAIVTTRYGLPVWVGIILAVSLPALVAFLTGRPILKLKPIPLVLTTLALGEIMYILFMELVPLTQGFSGIANIPRPTVLGYRLKSTLAYYYFTWAFVLVVIKFSINLANSRLGRAIRALREDEVAAKVVGIDTARLKTSVYMISAGMAGLAGALYSHFVSFISPDTFNILFSARLLMMVLVGGAKVVWGGLTGAVFFTILPELLRAYKDYQVLVYGIILIVVLKFTPNGLAGGVNKVFTIATAKSKTRLLGATLGKAREQQYINSES